MNIQADKIIAISNTGPLISAFQCGRTDLLKRYYFVIYITASGVTELEEHGWGKEIHQLISDGTVVVIQSLTNVEQQEAEQVARQIAADPTSGDTDWHTHLPEAEAIVLMHRRIGLQIEQILLDEQAARRVAQRMGLRFTGFPGILGRAGLDGLLTKDEIRQLLKTCQQQGTHYSDALIETVSQNYGR